MKLPPLDPVAKNHYQKFMEYFQNQLAKTDGISNFSGFMQAALYGEDVGFYTSSNDIFGSRGDFLTAPEISPLFAESIAQQCQQILKAIPRGVIFELGAGSGIFARDLLLALEKMQSLPEKYYIYEISPSLRSRQKIFLQKHCPHYFSSIEWIDNLENLEIEGLVIGNEVLDALPVDIFRIETGVIKEKFVTLKNNELCSFYAEPATPGLKSAVQTLYDAYQLPANYESEINLQLLPWLENLASILKRGVMLFIDYGYERHTYYHPDRSMGTLMCYYQHLKHSNPLLYPGLQDITAHVDFTTVAETHGMTVAGFTTQAEFLLALGVLTRTQQVTLSSVEHFRQTQALKKLIFPHEMGEIIKVMGLTKNFDERLIGFSQNHIF